MSSPVFDGLIQSMFSIGLSLFIGNCPFHYIDATSHVFVALRYLVICRKSYDYDKSSE